MLSKRNSVKKAAIYLIVVSMLIFIGSWVYAAEECQLIQLSVEKAGVGSQIIIAPKSITVPVGTCTVWVNFIKDNEITVSFRDNAKKCQASTEATKEFGLMDLKEGESCYLSQPLGLGGSSGLIWKEPGEYKYTIQYASKVPTDQLIGPVLGEGVIIVEKK